MKHIFIIGSKGIPAKYGGFETFVDNLTKRKNSKNIQYHVSCYSEDNSTEYYYNGARCFNVKVPNTGSSKAVIYDLLSIREVTKYIKVNNLKNCIIYVLACRIGPFINHFKKTLKKSGSLIFVNPDGHEWKRSKWNKYIRKYWKVSEGKMIKMSDLVVCDSKGIETYIQKEYRHYKPETKFIAYGAEINNEIQDTKNTEKWLNDHDLKKYQYYLIVGRFVPENNYELIIKEFMKSTTNKKLVIISNVENNSFFSELLLKTQFNQDSRIQFVGTIYEENLLRQIREFAFGYLHGHEVGGTNPSLLEAMATTKINLLLDVVFNKEVGENGALYFKKDKNSLSKLINRVDVFNLEEVSSIEEKAKRRIKDNYSWNKIVKEYEYLFNQF